MELNAIVAKEVKRGWRVESQAENQAVLVKGRRPNHILHLLLSVVTGGIWLPIWILVAMTGGEKRKVVSSA